MLVLYGWCEIKEDAMPAMKSAAASKVKIGQRQIL